MKRINFVWKTNQQRNATVTLFICTQSKEYKSRHIKKEWLIQHTSYIILLKTVLFKRLYSSIHETVRIVPGSVSGQIPVTGHDEVLKEKNDKIKT